MKKMLSQILIMKALSLIKVILTVCSAVMMRKMMVNTAMSNSMTLTVLQSHGGESGVARKVMRDPITGMFMMRDPKVFMRDPKLFMRDPITGISNTAMFMMFMRDPRDPKMFRRDLKLFMRDSKP